MIYKSRVSGGVQGPKQAPACSPQLPAFTAQTPVAVLPSVLARSLLVPVPSSASHLSPLLPAPLLLPFVLLCFPREAHHHQRPV